MPLCKLMFIHRASELWRHPWDDKLNLLDRRRPDQSVESLTIALTSETWSFTASNYPMFCWVNEANEKHDVSICLKSFFFRPADTPGEAEFSIKLSTRTSFLIDQQSFILRRAVNFPFRVSIIAVSERITFWMKKNHHLYWNHCPFKLQRRRRKIPEISPSVWLFRESGLCGHGRKT